MKKIFIGLVFCSSLFAGKVTVTGVASVAAASSTIALNTDKIVRGWIVLKRSKVVSVPKNLTVSAAKKIAGK